MQPTRSPEVDQLLHELTQPVGRDDPYPRYEALRRTAPVALAEDGAIVLTRYDDCHQVLHDHSMGRPDPQAFMAAIGLPDWRSLPAVYSLNASMLSQNPPEHTRLRRLVSRSFTARRVEQLKPTVTALVDRLLDDLEGGGDFVDVFAFPLPVAVIGELLGVPEADRPGFQPLVRDWTMILDVFDLDVLARANEAAAELRAYLGELVAERRKSPQDDLISALAGLPPEQDGLSDDELVTMAALLFSAGFETTTHLLGNGLVALLENPSEGARLRTDPTLAPRAAEELIRFDSSVQITNRLALADTTVGGVPLPAGSRIVCYLGAANHDEARFDEPARLRLDRQEGAPLSFGGGIHYCLGAPLARLEAQEAFPALLRRFPDLAVTGTPQRRQSLTLRGYLSLPVTG